MRIGGAWRDGVFLLAAWHYYYYYYYCCCCCCWYCWQSQREEAAAAAATSSGPRPAPPAWAFLGLESASWCCCWFDVTTFAATGELGSFLFLRIVPQFCRSHSNSFSSSSSSSSHKNTLARAKQQQQQQYCSNNNNSSLNDAQNGDNNNICGLAFGPINKLLFLENKKTTRATERTFLFLFLLLSLVRSIGAPDSSSSGGGSNARLERLSTTREKRAVAAANLAPLRTLADWLAGWLANSGSISGLAS